MGAKNKNFYYNLACEYGYEEIATKIQDLYLSGDKQAAEDILPNELVEDLTLVGPKDEIGKKLEKWKNSNITELSLSTPTDIETIKFFKEIL